MINTACVSRWALRFSGVSLAVVCLAAGAGGVRPGRVRRARAPATGQPRRTTTRARRSRRDPKPRRTRGTRRRSRSGRTPRPRAGRRRRPPAGAHNRPVVSVSGSRTHASTVQRDAGPAGPPPKPASQNQVEALIRRSTDSVDFFELVDDMLDEVARQVSLVDPNLLSPMAIRLVRLSANLRPEFARTLEARLMARLVQSTRGQGQHLRRVRGAAVARRERRLGRHAGRRQARGPAPAG